MSLGGQKYYFFRLRIAINQDVELYNFKIDYYSIDIFFDEKVASTITFPKILFKYKEFTTIAPQENPKGKSLAGMMSKREFVPDILATSI